MLFLAPGDIGKGRVEPISWMQTCRSYADRGVKTTLVSLRVRRPDAVPIERIWEHYGLQPVFQVLRLPTLLSRDSSDWSFRIWAGSWSLSVAVIVFARQLVRPRRMIAHARAPVLAIPFLLLNNLVPPRRRLSVVLEVHSIPRLSHAWIVRRADLIVTNSAKLAHDVSAFFEVPTSRIVHAPLGPYNRVEKHDRADARRRLSLPEDVAIGAYVGKLTQEIGEFLFQAALATHTKMNTFRLLIVGGNPAVIDWASRRISDLGLDEIVILAGFVEPSKVDLYQAAADVLVLYVPASFPTFPYCTPSKAYEYQAAERSIVAADFPLFEEVLGRDGERALRVAVHSPQAMADGIVQALKLGDAGRAMAERAAIWVRERTWERRAELILGAFGL